MNFEGALYDAINRNTAMTGNSAYMIKEELKDINRTLEMIFIQLKVMNDLKKEQSGDMSS